jgi:hypothetical protein
MMAETQSGVSGIPQYALWTLAGWVLSCLIFGWSGYCRGLRAQINSGKLKARNQVLAIIDRVMADTSNIFDLLHLYMSTRETMRDAVFKFTSQFGEAARHKIEEAWNHYEKMTFDGHWSPTEGNPDTEAFRNDKKNMIETLKKLRDEIKRM